VLKTRTAGGKKRIGIGGLFRNIIKSSEAESEEEEEEKVVQDDMQDDSSDLSADDMDPVYIKSPGPVLKLQKIEPTGIPRLKQKSEIPAKTATSKLDNLEPTKTVTREEADAAKVQRIKPLTQDLSKPDSKAKEKEKAKAQRRQQQISLVEDGPARIKPPQTPIDLTGSELKQELIKRGEAMANMYHDKFGIETAIVRIGSCFPAPLNHRMLSSWMSYDDFVTLIERVFIVSKLGCPVIYGASDNTSNWWDNSDVSHLGWKPKDNAEDYRKDIDASMERPKADAPEVVYQGGTFTADGIHEE
jgi:hypothetical protein